MAAMRDSPPIPGSVPHEESVWRAPMMGLALVITAGIVLDRYASVPLPVSVGVAVLSGIAGFASLAGSRRHALSLVYFAVSAAALGAVRHQYQKSAFALDDLG